MRTKRGAWSTACAPLGVLVFAWLATIGSGESGRAQQRAAAENDPQHRTDASAVQRAARIDFGRFGFLPESRGEQERFEKLALSIPNAESAGKWLRELTEEPHVAGTPQDYDTAVYVRDELRRMGIDAELVEYRVLLNYPKHVAAWLRQPKDAPIPLQEPGHPRDKDSYSPDTFPAFHGYGASGAASGQVVYVNYGEPDDFKKLQEMGVSVEGRIVLARYGRIFRGLKVKNAQDRGAAGVLLYSDPADDGYMKGDIYPDGPFRPEWAIQRGSVQFLSLAPGDPTTPGWPSTPDAKRIPWDENTDRARIASLPISYGAARPILEALAGPVVPEGWQGGLPFAYHIGPGPAEVEMQVEMDYAIRPTWNVIATVPGSVDPDRWVLMGNHRDAWTYGAVDPNSGTAAWLETARAIAAARKAGWKPRRPIVFASWDAEEYGLVGSTEWAEHHADELSEKAVLLLNVDSAVSGAELSIGGTPSLRDLVLGAAADVDDPRQGKPLLEVWRQRELRAWADAEPICLDRPDPPFVAQLTPLGSGSDYTAFVDHLGVPSADVDFTGHYGVYHSMYDNLFWMEEFGDPGYVFHTTAARLYILILMRAAAAELVPMRFAPYAAALANYRDDLKRRLVRKARLAGLAKEADATAWNADFGAIDGAITAFQEAAGALDAALQLGQESDRAEPNRLSALNDAVVQIERRFLNSEGLPGRKWFRHLIYAPGVTTGYEAWPLPGVRQAIEEDDPGLFAGEAARLTERLDAATAAMREAARLAAALRENE